MKRNPLFTLIVTTTLLLASAVVGSPVRVWAASDIPLILGIHPYLSTRDLTDRFTPLAHEIGQAVGRPVVISISPDYKAHEDVVGKNGVDLAYMGPAAYVQMVERYGEKPLLGRLEVHGKPDLYGHVFVAEKSPVRRLEDLMGRSFAFADTKSTMGHILPRYLLLEAGIDLKLLGRYAFLANHDNVALAVLMGEFDAGGIKSETFDKYKGRGLRSIAVTPPISEHVFVASSHLAPRLAENVRTALFGLKDTEKGRDILKGVHVQCTGIVPVKNSDYDPLRKVIVRLRKVGVEP